MGAKCPKCGVTTIFPNPMVCGKCYLKAHPGVPDLLKGDGYVDTDIYKVQTIHPTAPAFDPAFFVEPWAEKYIFTKSPHGWKAGDLVSFVGQPAMPSLRPARIDHLAEMARDREVQAIGRRFEEAMTRAAKEAGA